MLYGVWCGVCEMPNGNLTHKSHKTKNVATSKCKMRIVSIQCLSLSIYLSLSLCVYLCVSSGWVGPSINRNVAKMG